MTTENKTVTLDIEVTDTFNGEANYCWVKRYTLKYTGEVSDLSLMRRVKKLIGWNGYRCHVDDFGDGWHIRPRGLLQICFVTTRYSQC